MNISWEKIILQERAERYSSIYLFIILLFFITQATEDFSSFLQRLELNNSLDQAHQVTDYALTSPNPILLYDSINVTTNDLLMILKDWQNYEISPYVREIINGSIAFLRENESLMYNLQNLYPYSNVRGEDAIKLSESILQLEETLGNLDNVNKDLSGEVIRYFFEDIFRSAMLILVAFGFRVGAEDIARIRLNYLESINKQNQNLLGPGDDSSNES